MGSGYAKKKKEARAMQENFARMQEEMKNKTVEGTAGNGLVTVQVSGEGDLKKIKINPECVDKEDIEGLEDLIKAAFNDASNKIKEMPTGMPNIPDLGSFGL